MGLPVVVVTKLITCLVTATKRELRPGPPVRGQERSEILLIGHGRQGGALRKIDFQAATDLGVGEEAQPQSIVIPIEHRREMLLREPNSCRQRCASQRRNNQKTSGLDS